MDLRERLLAYEVTLLPRRRRPVLRLVWSVAAEDAPPAEPARAVAPLAVLVDYRITRVPGRVAS